MYQVFFILRFNFERSIAPQPIADLRSNYSDQSGPVFTNPFICHDARRTLLELSSLFDGPLKLLNLNSFRVAVVEDDPLLCQILEALLQDYGAICTAFPNADDALIAILGTGQPDLLITDHLVPGQLTGADLADLLTSRWPTLPIIVTSGYGYDVQAGLSTNVVYLPKPWFAETLEQAIAQALR